MPDITVSNSIDTFMQSVDQAAMRTNLALGDAATKNTGTTAGTVAAGDAVVLKSGSTMTGRLNLPALAGQAALNLGGTTTVATPATGDVWIAPDSSLKWQNGATTNTALTGTVAIANGGTGQTTANAALNALLPAQASNNTKLLSTDGTNASWTTAFKFSNTKVVGVDAATIQGCIDLVSSPTALTQVQVLIPPGVYNENLTLKPCVSLASTGLNNGQSSIVRIVGTHTLTGGTSAGDNIIQLNGLRMDYSASTSPTLTINATGTTPLLVHMQDCMIGNSNASTSSVGVLVNQYCSLRCNNVKSVANATSGSGGTHIEVNAGTFYGDQFSTEYGTLALRLSGTGGSFKPYAELKQCSLSCTGSNVVDITSTTALFSAGWTGFTNNATTGNGINIAAGSVIGVFNSVFVITAGASNYVVTGGSGGVYYSLNNSYSNATGVPYETKVNANISQFLYSSSIPSALTALTGDVTASGTGSQAATVARIQGRNVLSTAPTNGQVLAWNGTAWAPAAAGGTGTVTSVGVSGGTTGLTTSGGPVTSSGTITLAGTLGVANGGTGATTLTGIVKGSGTSALSAAVAGTDYVVPSGNITGTASNVTGTVAIANGGTGQTTQQAAINALAGATTSGQFLRGNGTNVTLSAIQAADVPTLNQNTTGTASNVTGTVAVANGGTGATALTGLVKGNGTSAFTAATAGTDYVVPSGNITGTASNVTGTVAIANGGTGQTTAANAINALVPAQSGQSGKVLTTNGSVVSWGTAGGGITALTGDVSASGSGSVSASVTGLRGRVVATTAPTAGQVLGWNATTNQWEPTSAGGAVSYDILKILFVGPASGTYNVPSGYKYADIYAAGAGGGGGSGQYLNSYTVGYGGGGGAHGVFGRRQKLGVENASINYELSAGGSGGVPDGSGNGANGTSGTGTLVYFSVTPTSGSSSSIILDCGYYINAGGQSNTWGYSGQAGGTAGQLSLFSVWPQNIQNGGVGGFGMVGGQPQLSSYSLETFNISAGAGGGGISTGTPYDGGNILDLNYMLYVSGVHQVFNGIAGLSTTIDASPVPLYLGQNIFWGGAGGAGADAGTAVYSGSFYRAGNGADGGLGCGGGGGGAIYDSTNDPNNFRPGSGGNGGAGFLLMYLYK